MSNSFGLLTTFAVFSCCGDRPIMTIFSDFHTHVIESSLPTRGHVISVKNIICVNVISELDSTCIHDLMLFGRYPITKYVFYV